MTALEQLTSHFKSRERKPIVCGIIDAPMFAKPASVEDYLTIELIQKEPHVVKRARRMAAYIAKHVLDSEDKPVFTGSDVAKTLATEVSGEVLLDIFSQLFSPEVAGEIEDAEKKSEPVEETF